MLSWEQILHPVSWYPILHPVSWYPRSSALLGSLNLTPWRGGGILLCIFSVVQTLLQNSYTSLDVTDLANTRILCIFMWNFYGLCLNMLLSLKSLTHVSYLAMRAALTHTFSLKVSKLVSMSNMAVQYCFFNFRISVSFIVMSNIRSFKHSISDVGSWIWCWIQFCKGDILWERSFLSLHYIESLRSSRVHSTCRWNL